MADTTILGLTVKEWSVAVVALGGTSAVVWTNVNHVTEWRTSRKTTKDQRAAEEQQIRSTARNLAGLFRTAASAIQLTGKLDSVEHPERYADELMQRAPTRSKKADLDKAVGLFDAIYAAQASNPIDTSSGHRDLHAKALQAQATRISGVFDQ